AVRRAREAPRHGRARAAARAASGHGGAGRPLPAAREEGRMSSGTEPRNGERRTMLERPAVERRRSSDRRDRMRRINTIHFVGIGGSGMSGIAEVLLNLGY